MRHPGLFGTTFWANPFGEGWDGQQRLGDVRIDTGTYNPTEVDLALPSGGPIWVIGRTYNSVQRNSTNTGYYNNICPQGVNWFQSSQPELVLTMGGSYTEDTIYLVYGADRYIEFQRTGEHSDYYKAKNGAAGIIRHDAYSGSATPTPPGTYTYYDQAGNQVVFFDGDYSDTPSSGQLWTITDANSRVAYVGDPTSVTAAITNGYTGNGNIKLAYDSAERRYTYTYSSLSTILDSVVAHTKTGLTWASPGTVTEVGRVEYSYYTSTVTDQGMSGDLKLVTTTTPLTSGSLVKHQYYRYYTGTYNSSSNPGSPHQIKLVLGYEGARQYDVDDTPATPLSFDSTGVSAATLKTYASIYLEYYDTSTASENGKKRIRNAMFNGECGCSGGTGNGTYAFSYEVDGGFSNTSGYDAAWKSRVTLTRPTSLPTDASWELKYFDEVGQPLSKVVLNNAPGSSPSASWANYVVRDGNGCVTDIATSAASLYTDGTRVIAESGTTELVNVIERCDSTLSAFTGKSDLDGLPVGQQYRAAGGGTKYYTSAIDPDAFSVTLSGSIAIVRPISAGSSVYPTATTTRTDSSRNHTAFANTPYTSTIMFEQIDTTLPAVTTGNNGSNSGNTRSEYFTIDGRRRFAKNEEGIIAYSAYDAYTGLQTVSIQDTNTSSGDLTGVTIPSGFSTSGTALHYKTLYAYDAQGRLSSTTLTDGTVAPMCYLKLDDGRPVTLGSPKTTGSAWYGPATCTISNQSNKPIAQCTIDFAGNTTSTAMTSWITSSATNPVGAVAAGAIARMTFNTYDKAGVKVLESDRYFLIPSSWPGSSSSNFDPSAFGYDAMARRWRTKTPAGDLTRIIYDPLGRATARWMGTNDNSASFPDGDLSGTVNMTMVELLAYDGGSSGGNSNLTSRTVDEDGNWATTTDQRVTSFGYDVRNRQVLTTSALAPHMVAEYDNLGRTVAMGQYDASSGLSPATIPTSTASVGGTKRVALTESAYDEMGRVWKSIRHKITQSSGADADHLDTLNWFDPVGRMIKTNGEMLTKTRYDRLGRSVKQYTLSKDNDSGYSNVYASGQTDISGDTIVEQVETVYDNDASYKTGLPILRVAISRHWNESSGTTVDLDSNGDGDPLTVTATNINGRLQITSSWYDEVNRPKATVNVGSFGIVGDGATTATAYARGADPRGTVPTRSDTVLVTSYAYDYASNPAYNTSAVPGEYTDVTDPLALVSRTVTDAAGRKVCTIANLSSPSVPISTMNRDTNVFTRFTYAAGLMIQLMVDLDGDGNVDSAGANTDQITSYFYGTTKTASYSPSKICSGGLLRAIKYPDSASSATNAAGIDSNDSGVVAYAYNALGQKISESDPAGNALAYTYDLLGRETLRGATAASGFDNDVQEIDTDYLTRGLVNTITQKGASAVVKDQLQYSYDDWGNLTLFEQDPDGVIGAGGQSSFAVAYSYAKAGSSTTRNTLRRSGMTTPDGTTLTYTYASGINADLSRITAINNGTIDLAQYNYMGLASVVYTIMPGPQAWTSALESGSDKTYPYWDRFNRPTHNQWEKTYANPAAKFYNVDVAYDRNSNITSVVDNVQKTDTPPNSPINSYDVLYTMDGLNRLIDVNEGNKSGGSIGIQSRGEMWKDYTSGLQLSQTGNWDTYRLAISGTSYVDDARTHDAANKLTSSNLSAITSYDNGSIADLGSNFGSYQYQYDAFNRLRFIKDKGGDVLQEYRYNGLGYRIAWHYNVTDSVGGPPDSVVDSYDPWYFFCYDESWRMVATFMSGYDSPKEQFYNHGAGLGGYGKSSYIDSVIMRDRDMTAGWIGAADGTLEERSWYCQNWRADVSAVLDATGGMKEWVKYSAYGVPLGIPAGDVTGNGVTDTTDKTKVGVLATAVTVFGASNYDVRADRNLDGTINGSDDTDVKGLIGTNMGRGVLSRDEVDNRKGYAGYEGSGGGINDLWQVRHRTLNSSVGRWGQRDPLGYVNVASMDVYADSPINVTDPSGQFLWMAICCPACAIAMAAGLVMSWGDCARKSTLAEQFTCMLRNLLPGGPILGCIAEKIATGSNIFDCVTDPQVLVELTRLAACFCCLGPAILPFLRPEILVPVVAGGVITPGIVKRDLASSEF